MCEYEKENGFTELKLRITIKKKEYNSFLLSFIIKFKKKG